MEHFGEGEYSESERVIRELLKENGAMSLPASAAKISGDGVEQPAASKKNLPKPIWAIARLSGSHRPNEWLQIQEGFTVNLPPSL
jgi:hypothetical protein